MIRYNLIKQSKLFDKHRSEFETIYIYKENTILNKIKYYNLSRVLDVLKLYHDIEPIGPVKNKFTSLGKKTILISYSNPTARYYPIIIYYIIKTINNNKRVKI